MAAHDLDMACTGREQTPRELSDGRSVDQAAQRCHAKSAARAHSAERFFLGRVIARDDAHIGGVPVENARVAITRVPRELDPAAATTRTDAQGGFRLLAPKDPLGLQCELGVWHADTDTLLARRKLPCMQLLQHKDTALELVVSTASLKPIP